MAIIPHKVKLKDGDNWTSLLDLLYPVGCVYISYTEITPASEFGGTWSAITGKFLYANAANGTGGSNDAIVPYHTHTFTGSSASISASFSGTKATLSHSSHNHSLHVNSDGATYKAPFVKVGNGNWSLHKVKTGTDSVNYFLMIGNTSYDVADGSTSGGTTVTAHSYTPAGSVSGSVTATGSNSYAGTSGNTTNANMPAYQAVYAWRRTA